MRTLLGRLASIALALGGGLLCYFAGWVALVEILPKVLESGVSLRGSSLILNRVWQGNQLYVLLALYSIGGISLLVGSAYLWRRQP